MAVDCRPSHTSHHKLHPSLVPLIAPPIPDLTLARRSIAQWFIACTIHHSFLKSSLIHRLLADPSPHDLSLTPSIDFDAYIGAVDTSQPHQYSILREDNELLVRSNQAFRGETTLPVGVELPKASTHLKMLEILQELFHEMVEGVLWELHECLWLPGEHPCCWILLDTWRWKPSSHSWCELELAW